ncbi:MAG: ATP-binding protein [Azospirillum sp.]|nr:ATP-binding protein [Azospirillum sp.]
MTKIFELNIKHFRGIASLSQNFANKSVICLVGRGDSGKTTILEAISLLFSPSRIVSIYDTDFYNCDISKNIEISATVTDFPSYFLQEDKFGLSLKSIKDNKICDNFTDETDAIPALTIKLTVDSTLEPNWSVVDAKSGETKISAVDRAKFNVFMITDYVDRHFSWSKDNILSRYLKNSSEEGNDLTEILNIARDTKKSIDEKENGALKDIHEKLKDKAKNFGVPIDNLHTSIDFKDMMIRESNLCLYDDIIPLKYKGKGTKKLLSIALQHLISDKKGIILVDEVEQGLEPDRIKHLLRTFTKDNNGQIFFTTHSREAVVELSYSQIGRVQKNDDNTQIVFPDEELQNVIRAEPDFLFAKRIIVCEGKTEVGLCRALDKCILKDDSCTYHGVVYICGNGDSFLSYCKKLKAYNFDILCICDSDVSKNKEKIEELKALGVKFIQCDDGKCIEEQIFYDLPWESVCALIKKRINDTDINAIKSSYKTFNDVDFPEDYETFSGDKQRDFIRCLLSSICGKKSKTDNTQKELKAWYKNITAGEELGKYIFSAIGNIPKTSTFYKNIEEIIKWVKSA